MKRPTLSFDVPRLKPGRWYVYVVWGEDRSRPLYVGQTGKVISRLGQHLEVVLWSEDVRTVDCYEYRSFDSALDAEKVAIERMNPIYNRMRRPSKATLRRIQEEAAEERERKRAELLARRHKPAPPPPPPKPRRQTHVTRRPEDWPDFFTPEQWEIVTRVQDIR